MRSLTLKAWVLLMYSMPTSFLLLFASTYTLRQTQSGPSTNAVSLGNRELVAMVAVLSLLIVLNLGGAIQFWLDPRKPEMFVRYAVGADPLSVLARQAATVLAANSVGFGLAAVAYVLASGRSWTGLMLPSPSSTAIAVAFVAASLLVCGVATASIARATHRRDWVSVY